jgi:hypothetical protein
MIKKKKKKWTELEIDPDTEKRYHKLLESLYRLEAWGDEEGPHVLKLSAESKDAWVRWYDTWAREQEAVEGELAAAFSKLEEAAGRFALVHHVVTRIDRGDSDLCPVEVESIEAGVTLARWFAQESRRVYAILVESDEQRDIRRLVDFIRSHGGKMTVRELQRSNGRKYPVAAAAEDALQKLVEAGLGRWAEPDGDNRARVMELCPTPDTSDTGPEPADSGETAPSDTLSNSNGKPPISSGKNGQVSDMSDCRKGTQDRDDRKLASTDQKQQVSDTDCGPPPPGMRFLLTTCNAPDGRKSENRR